MPELVGSSFAGVAIAAAGVILAVVLVVRYRSLMRRGTPLPPGAGGARLRGLEVGVRQAHVPGVRPGVVHVLGDDWTIAEDVDVALPVGTRVRVVAVVGTRLVVEPVEDGAAGPSAVGRADDGGGDDGVTSGGSPPDGEPSGSSPHDTGSPT